MFDQLDMGASSNSELTLKDAVSCLGHGLHSGRDVTLTLRPALAGTGIVFRRIDLLASENVHDQPDELARISVKASPANVATTTLGTTLANEHGVSISTVEHLLAAFAGFGLTDVMVELNGPEVPIMDGSSEPFVALIDQAGVCAVATPRRALRIIEKISVQQGDRWAYILPTGEDEMTLDVLVDFPDPAIGRQSVSFDVTPEIFRADVSAARTFCNLKDVETMREQGLALGGSEDNAIIVNDGAVLNAGGLRFESEFAMHKALDLLGDLYLLGLPIAGHVMAFKPGHDLNVQLAQAVMDAIGTGAVELVELGVVAASRATA